MTKTPFNIKYRPQIESGEYKVVTREDRPIEIKIWDLKGDFPVVGVYYDEKNDRDIAVQVTAEGRCSVNPDESYSDDFFLVKADPKPTEFEKAFLGIIKDCDDSALRKKYQEYFKESCATLLEAARKELMLDYGAKYNEGRTVGIELGKIEAMKDIPRWKSYEGGSPLSDYELGTENLYFKDMYIKLSELEKLPKEE